LETARSCDLGLIAADFLLYSGSTCNFYTADVYEDVKAFAFAAMNIPNAEFSAVANTYYY
jgi:hypothetical protein